MRTWSASGPATEKEFMHATLDAVFDVELDPTRHGLCPVWKNCCQEAEQAVRNGCSIIILSDRSVSEKKAPIPSLLAGAAVNRHLVVCGLRTRMSLIIESGEPREVMHFALLLGYGATAVNPEPGF